MNDNSYREETIQNTAASSIARRRARRLLPGCGLTFFSIRKVRKQLRCVALGRLFHVWSGDSVIPQSDGDISSSTNVKHRKPTDVEIRFEFNPIALNMDDSVVPIFIVIARDGRARALRHHFRYQTRNVESYEGELPEAVVQQLFARVNAAFRLPKYRKDYDRRNVYEDNSFYLALKSHTGKVKEMLGGDGPRPDEVRSLIARMSELWKSLSVVPPAFAYLTRRPVEKDRLILLRRQGPSRLTPIESLPATLQSLLIPVVTQPLNFYPLTQEQYDRIQTYKPPMTYKGRGYELAFILAAKERELKTGR